MKYKLIAIDLDGTLLDKEGAIIPSAKEAIQRVVVRGMMVTLATGRMYRPTNRFARELQLRDPIICYQGALIREPDHKDVLWHKPLPVVMAQEIIDQVRRLGVHQYVFVDDEMYVEEIKEKDLWYAERNSVELNLVDDLMTLLKSPPTEIAARGEPEAIDRMIAHLKAYFGESLLVCKVHSSFCEIAHPESGKGNALKYLAERLGVEQGQVIAIGDGPNDVSMLKWAGLGIAIGDAPEEIKAAADLVVDADGSLAQTMEELLEM